MLPAVNIPILARCLLLLIITDLGFCSTCSEGALCVLPKQVHIHPGRLPAARSQPRACGRGGRELREARVREPLSGVCSL